MRIIRLSVKSIKLKMKNCCINESFFALQICTGRNGTNLFVAQALPEAVTGLVGVEDEIENGGPEAQITRYKQEVVTLHSEFNALKKWGSVFFFCLEKITPFLNSAFVCPLSVDQNSSLKRNNIIQKSVKPLFLKTFRRLPASFLGNKKTTIANMAAPI